MSVYLLVLCVALLQQEGRASPDPPGCNSSEAVRVAEEVLEQINQDRTNGYILSLNRLYDLSHTPEKDKDGSLYKLTIDVMETKCHIISRKPWKQCEIRDIGDVPVYGECEVSAFVDTHVKLQSYSCVLREVPATAVVDVCPDCPTADNLNEPVVKETANLSLQRFNEESRLANYFTLENITRASSQHRGSCLGSHMELEEQFVFRPSAGNKGSSFQKRNSVDVKCEIYEPQAAVVEEQAHAKADSGHTEHQHHNHTHLHPHEHMHLVTPSSDLTVSRPRGSLGTVVEQPASPRSAPAASSCPGPRRHNLGIDRPKL
ncbi:fetuin-B-like isoform X2 [Trachinotus anak]|uniref:fetuin-B-like isoform X2 n=1 Tax=Trachinotus anak TaxID=443729 RepID=UPI0039F218A0